MNLYTMTLWHTSLYMTNLKNFNVKAIYILIKHCFQRWYNEDNHLNFFVIPHYHGTNKIFFEFHIKPWACLTTLYTIVETVLKTKGKVNKWYFILFWKNQYTEECNMTCPTIKQILENYKSNMSRLIS